MRSRSRFIVLIIAFTFGCQRDRPDLNLPSDGKRSYQEFMAAVKPGRYEAPEARKNQIIQNYEKLKPGMSKEQVAFLIGDPDYSDPVYGPKGFNPKWKGWHWRYNIVCDDARYSNQGRDKWIEVFFGTDDLAILIAPSPETGLPSK
jgi:hypothetical protein